MPQTHFVPSGNTISEDDLTLPDEASDSDDEEDDVPIRLLDHFSIFHRRTHEFIPALRLLTEELCEDWVGTGYVRPSFGDTSTTEDEDEGMGSQLVQLSSVLECNVHWPVRDGRSWSLDQ